ncbi:response regulator [Pedobacter sp. N36a]|uniref:response regulator n=1 Tax=Pedobacter sp. N36a TaxID=2767996 RepID=UPI0016574C6D|nr:response regulator [Pedobacter sp. N36a]MBC8985386.1 response regulator [Pedobacter sp. N36a]
MNSLKKIALIDDDSTFVFLTKRMIKAANVSTQLDEFKDGLQAITFIKDNQNNSELLPDVIFLDLSMPIMDGWEFLEEFTVLQPAIKKRIMLYIVSSSISPHDIERSRNFSVVSDFIIKPLNKERFIQIMGDLS